MTAWSQGFSGTGVTIGIVDSGIDVSSPEFAGRIAAASRDVVASRGLTNADSDHGTNVAMVAAAARNSTGIMGIAYSATIAMFRADEVGSCATEVASDPKSGCKFADSAVASGVNAAVANGAKVINLSLGGEAPNSTVMDAIRTAAANGVVVVVSAGNDGNSTDPAVDPNNPDPFAAGLRAAGNGNVIIAGSVDASNAISAFSNRAGAEASWYLAARGARICCGYKNGVLEVINNADGSQSNWVFSGTSFAAPQIAGAAALLRQAFPNLTAAQVVDLLLKTAKDAGAAGTDAIYGRGVLDIAAAFAPQGATSLAGTATAVTLGATTALTSAAMGDAVTSASSLRTLVLDSYGRAYSADLAAGLRSAPQASRLAPALIGQIRSLSLSGAQRSLAFTVDASRNDPLRGTPAPLRLTTDDADASRVLAAQAMLKLAPHTQLAIGYAQGIDGLVAHLQGHSQPAFLIARLPIDDLGFRQDHGFSVALRREFGPWGLTAGMDNASTSMDSIAPSSPIEPRLTAAAPANRLSFAIDRRKGTMVTSLAASWLDERRTVLGAWFENGLAGRGAQSLFLDARAGAGLAPGWRIGGSVRGGMTWLRAGGLVAPGSRLLSTAWAVDLSREGVFNPADSLALRISQPLRVESGGMALHLPVDWSYATLQPTFENLPLSLTPRGREIDTEINWRGAIAGGVGMVSLYRRQNPGHFRNASADHGAAATWSAKF